MELELGLELGKNLKIAPQGARGWGSEFSFSFQNFYYIFSGAHAKI
jgi:hypothetical protein